ncbi:MAG TPA: TIR domain-containing protein [Steroidobacteraceae bacterium]|nr:TIR domain-containing protein [Steroidobacteraceae bacterium]
MSTGAVFLSYTSQDSAAALRLCEGLRGHGIEVWLDQSELRGGDAWDASIRGQIKGCALFVPLISANTQARDEGYFRLEWRLGVERSQLMADDHAFLLPVVVDDTPEVAARVPAAFRERQWTRLKGGEATPEFIARVQRLLAGEAVETRPSVPKVPVARAPKPKSQARTWIILASIAAATLVAMFGDRDDEERKPTKAPAPVAAESAPVASRKAIAVLPFENLSGRKEDAYLADGLQEEVLNALARLRDLTVISRTSVQEFRGNPENLKAIGERLNVGSVLEGSIRREGQTLRLTVQLVDARDDRHLLAANYDRDMGRLLDLQSAVARQVATALAATLSSFERGEFDRVGTNSGDAYDLYLRAVAAIRENSTEDAVRLTAARRLLTDALRLDPDYGDALALLAQVNVWSYFNSPQPEFAAAARQAFERALASDPKLPEALLARGLFAMYVSQDLPQAIVDLKTVVDVRPNLASAHSALAYALRRRGDFDGALPHFIRAWDLDPLNDRYSGGPITTYLGLRRYPEAIAQTELYLKRFPGSADPYFTRARIESFVQQNVAPLRAALHAHGDAVDPAYRTAVATEIARAEGRYLDAIRLLDSVPTDTPIDRKYRVGFLYYAAGDAANATRSFREAEKMLAAAIARGQARTDDPELLAVVQSMEGRHDEAIATIDRRIAGDPETRDATNGPELAFLRSIILVRAGRKEEGYAEVRRLLRVPFSTGANFFEDPEPAWLAVKDDPHYDVILRRPPRL